MSKKVLCIMNADRLGGAELSTMEVLTSLSDSFDYCIVSQLDPPSGLERKFCFIPMRPLHAPKRLADLFILAWTVMRMNYVISKVTLKRRDDLIYAHSIQSLFYCIIPKLLLRRKIIWHVRDRAPSAWIQKLAFRLSNSVVCVSNFIYNSLPGPGTKKRLLLNSIDIKAWKKQSGFVIHDELKLDRNTRVIANVSNLIPWKNQKLFIEAAKEVALHTDVHFVLIGGDTLCDRGKYFKQLRDLATEMGLAQRISFLGYKSNMMAYYNSIDILVHTAVEEPFGRVLIEAMALEKPVIAMRSGGPAEIILNGENGYLFEPNANANTVARYILSLLDDQRLRRSMGKNARSHVRNAYNLDNRKPEINRLFFETK